MKYLKKLSLSMVMYILLIVIVGSLNVSCSKKTNYRDLNHNHILDPYEDQELTVNEKVNDLISKMSIEEKIGMMLHPLFDIPDSGEFDSILAENLIGKYHMNFFLNNGNATPEKFAIWSNKVQKFAEGTRLGIPITFSADPRWQWVNPLGYAATWDPELVEHMRNTMAKQFRAVGISESLDPRADVATEPRWTRVGGTFGESAYLVSRMSEACILGFQGKTFDSTSVICMTKHFPGGGPEEKGLDPHGPKGQNMIYPGNKFNYHLYPWERVLAANTGAIMPYYGVPVGVDSVGNNFSKTIITDILRNKLGYNGVVCSDWGAADDKPWGVNKVFGADLIEQEWGGQIVKKGVSKDSILAMTYKLSLDAGVDQFGVWTFDGDEFRAILSLVKNGEVSEARIDSSVRRLLIGKYETGLFSNPYVIPEDAEGVFNSKEVNSLKRKVEGESVILMKNQGILPLKKDSKPSVYLAGFDKNVGFPDFRVVANPETADLAVIKVKGTTVKFNDENTEKQLIISDSIVNVIKTIRRQIEDVVLIFEMNNPLIIPRDILNMSSAVLAEWGVDNGILSDIFFGEINPSGKLPYELPCSLSAVMNQLEDVPFDSKNPNFSFGFGLSYTSFKYSDLNVLPVSASKDEFDVSLIVSNVGKVKGDEVVQLYWEDNPDNTKPAKYLIGFSRVSLLPGEAKKVTIRLTPKELGYYDQNYNFIVTSGERKLMIGSAMNDIRLKGTLTVKDRIKL